MPSASATQTRIVTVGWFAASKWAASVAQWAVTPAASTVVHTYSGERPPLTMLLQATSIDAGLDAATVAGANAAVAIIAPAASQPAVRARVPRRARRSEREVFIRGPRADAVGGGARSRLPGIPLPGRLRHPARPDWYPSRTFRGTRVHRTPPVRTASPDPRCATSTKRPGPSPDEGRGVRGTSGETGSAPGAIARPEPRCAPDKPNGAPPEVTPRSMSGAGSAHWGQCASVTARRVGGPAPGPG